MASVDMKCVLASVCGGPVYEIGHILMKLSSMLKGWDGFESHWRKQNNKLIMLLDSVSSGI